MEPFITQEDIEALKARDRRWQDVELAIKIDEELANSVTVNLILDTLTRRSQDAIEALLKTDPTDMRKIASLQEQVNCGRYIASSLHNIRQRGVVAHQSLEDEGNVELESPHAGSER
jgi:hypothetical protein